MTDTTERFLAQTICCGNGGCQALVVGGHQFCTADDYTNEAKAVLAAGFHLAPAATESDREAATKIAQESLWGVGTTHPLTLPAIQYVRDFIIQRIAADRAAVRQAAREDGFIAGLRRAEELCVARMLNDDAQLTFVDDIREEINRRSRP